MSLLLQLDPLWLLRNSPHVSFSTRFRIAGKVCEPSNKCIYTIERIVQFSLVLHSSVTANASVSFKSSAQSLIESASAMTVETDRSENKPSLLSSCNETCSSTDSALVGGTTEQRQHVSVSRVVADSR